MDELKKLLEDQGKAFHEFKDANDARIAAIEKNGKATPEMEAKVDGLNSELYRLGKEIKELTLASQRPAPGGDGKMSEDEREYKASFGKYLRKGDPSNLRDLEVKVVNIGADPEGGYFAPPEVSNTIDSIANTTVAMRRIATVTPIGASSWKEAAKTSKMTGGWLGEKEESSESTEPKFHEVEIVPQIAYAEPWATNVSLEDITFNVESWLAEEAGLIIAETEATGFITGTGVKSPRGIASYTATADATWKAAPATYWGGIGYIASGKSGAWADTNPADALINLQHALPAVYRNGAAFLMNDATLATIRKFKNGMGDYIWQPSVQAGIPDQVFGKPVEIDDNVADLSSDSLSIFYGNFKRAYRIVDRRGIAVIRDNVTRKGYTKFFITKRVGGGLKNFEAIKVMKFAAS